MKYFVIAVHWDVKARMCKEYIAGEFDCYSNARIFKDAYNKEYNTQAMVYTFDELINRK